MLGKEFRDERVGKPKRYAGGPGGCDVWFSAKPGSPRIRALLLVTSTVEGSHVQAATAYRERLTDAEA